MLPRFFVPDAGVAGTVVALSREEARHLSRVLRLGSGAHVRVFDGRGGEWLGKVMRAAGAGVEVHLLDAVQALAEPRIAIALVLAVLKGDKMDDVVRDAVMLGASAIHPVVTGRTEIGLAALARGGRRVRWERVAVASAKQCGRAVVPRIADPVTFDAHLADTADLRRVMLVEPPFDAQGGVRQVGQLAPAPTVLMVGPEGGWTDEEVQAAERKGATLVTLGARTLRADAVPLVALTALRAIWNDL